MEASKSAQKDVHTDRREYERPQPIKIAQLLGLSENLKSIQKDSVRKRIEPERLGAYSNTKSTRKNGKQNGAGTYIQSVNVQKCVRRNLDFNEYPTNSLKNSHENNIQSNKFTSNKSSDKKCSDSLRKKSLLLPPNTIKEKHLQKCTDKIKRHSKISGIPTKIVHSDKKGANQKEHKKVKAVNNLSPNNKSFNNNSTVLFDGVKPFNGQTDSTEPPKHVKAKYTDTNHVQCFEASPNVSECDISFQCTSNKKITNNENQSLTQYKLSEERFILNEANLEKECSVKEKKEEGERIQNICDNLQNTKLVDSENASSEMIYINKNKLMNLEHDLQNLLSTTEENVLKLKSMLMYIKNLNENITLPDADAEKKHIELDKINNIMVDKEVQVESCSNLIQYSGEILRTPILHTPQITVTNILSINRNQSIRNVENDRENYEFINRRRTSDGDGSFLELENQLNIQHTKSTQDPFYLQKTPVITRYEQKQKRSLREYMALKSTMKFLETPDGKKFNPLRQIDNIDNSVLNATYISNKILKDLHNLYSESPDS
ncbi:uncharacterized protein LOC100875383 isoform X2 [Megachile rotundata]